MAFFCFNILACSLFDSSIDGVIEDGVLSDEDPLVSRHLYIVAYLALDAYIGDESLASLGVYTGQVVTIGISIGVAILDVKEQDEVISILYDLWVIRLHVHDSIGYCSISSVGLSASSFLL